MKNIYECEICGKQFTNYDDCYKCECHHATHFTMHRARNEKYDFVDDVPCTDFEHGSALPQTIECDFEKYDIMSGSRTIYHAKYKLIKAISVKNFDVDGNEI